MPIFKGSTHIHSNWSSDGVLNLENLRRVCVDYGLHFLLLSEHQEDFSLERYEALFAACKALSSKNFLLIPGLEFHSDGTAIMGAEHFPGLSLSMSELLRHASAEGSFNVLVHPINLRSLPPREVISELHAVEVWNLRYDGERFPSFKNLAIWRHLSRNFPLAPIFGIDFHEKEGIGRAFIQVEMDSLSSEDLLDALRKGRFKLFSGNREWQMEVLSKGRNIQIFYYYWFRLLALKVYRKTRHLFSEKLNRRLKNLVNG